MTTPLLNREAIDRSEIPLALTTWRDAAGCAALDGPAEGRALGWLRSVWEAGATHVPLTFVFDLGFILLYGRRFRFRSLEGESPSSASATSNREERAQAISASDASDSSNDVEQDEEDAVAFQNFRLTYQDRVVSMWLTDPVVQDLHVHIAGLATEAQDQTIGHALLLALRNRLASATSLLDGNAGVLRSRVQTITRAATDGSSTEPAPVPRSPSGAWQDWCVASLLPVLPLLTEGVVFSPEDAWEVSHLDQLPTESTRLALRQIHHVSGEIGGLHAGAALAMRQRAREVPVEQVDAAAYPTGGFDAISTQGTFENLVRSEIAYVGEGAEGTLGVDLFDVRFVENELLFYTRDESPVLDAFRFLSIVVDEPDRLRTKAAQASAQTGVLVLGLALTLQADMLRAFGAAASKTRIRFHCRTDADQAAAQEDQGLLALSLASEIQHRRAEIDIAEDGAFAIEDATGVVFSFRPRPASAAAMAWIRVDGAEWTWKDDKGEETFKAKRPADLRALGDALLLAVASGGRRPM